MRQTLECPDSDHLAILTYADMDQLDEVTRECARIREATKSTGDVTRVASVPLEMVQKFCDLKGITYSQFMGGNGYDKEFLNSEEIKAFRTWQGRL
jgi:hypothetical protein